MYASPPTHLPLSCLEMHFPTSILLNIDSGTVDRCYKKRVPLSNKFRKTHIKLERFPCYRTAQNLSHVNVITNIQRYTESTSLVNHRAFIFDVSYSSNVSQNRLWEMSQKNETGA